jgi:hypothetical protein
MDTNEKFFKEEDFQNLKPLELAIAQLLKEHFLVMRLFTPSKDEYYAKTIQPSDSYGQMRPDLVGTPSHKPGSYEKLYCGEQQKEYAQNLNRFLAFVRYAAQHINEFKGESRSLPAPNLGMAYGSTPLQIYGVRLQDGYCEIDVDFGSLPFVGYFSYRIGESSINLRHSHEYGCMVYEPRKRRGGIKPVWLHTYVRTKEAHPFDFDGGFDSLSLLMAKLTELLPHARNANFNILVEWNPINDSDYSDAIRVDPFVTRGQCSHIIGRDTLWAREIEILFREVATRRLD